MVSPQMRPLQALHRDRRGIRFSPLDPQMRSFQWPLGPKWRAARPLGLQACWNVLDHWPNQNVFSDHFAGQTILAENQLNSSVSSALFYTYRLLKPRLLRDIGLGLGGRVVPLLQLHHARADGMNDRRTQRQSDQGSYRPNPKVRLVFCIRRRARQAPP